MRCAPLRPAVGAAAALVAVLLLAGPAAAQRFQSFPTWPTGFYYRPTVTSLPGPVGPLPRPPLFVNMNLGGVISGGGNYVTVLPGGMVPNGGITIIGGNSAAGDGRTEHGAPVLGKVPGLGRGTRNVGYGRTTTSQRVGVKVRIIDLREEEERQTGYRRP